MTDLNTGTLLAGSTIKGTDVYSPGGDHLGHIDDVMIDKKSGRVAYGVLQFGGFLGIGSDHHPIPFGKLNYDPARDGYVTDLTKDQLQSAPAAEDNWHRNRDWEERAHRHYGVNPYWY